ncbi:MAG: [Fe-Fe] hydrogenase large subunit C-terminal domain-containing protein [Rhodothermaceae bacterium]
MNPYFPVYTGQAECQDCYKCVRNCSAKAIRISDGKASVIQEKCILCGKCVEICPAGAKHIRSDTNRAKKLLQLKSKVFVSLAPSYINEFPEVKPEQLIAALKKLGFYGVSETALGAQEVSSHVARHLQTSGGINISSACPTAVQLIKKYHPEYSKNILKFHSPVLAHAGLLKEKYGDDIAIIFVSPCIAKKYESDQFFSLVQISLTFQGLRNWFEEENIDLMNIKFDKNDKFLPHRAEEGTLYPIEGGMIAGIKSDCSLNDKNFMSFSGIEEISSALDGLKSIEKEENLFIELLACKGGCINGPAMKNKSATGLKRYQIIKNSSQPKVSVPREPRIDIYNNHPVEAVRLTKYTENQITKILKKIGKHNLTDLINCGGCGYNSCKEFAEALLDGFAEKEMCVTYMRQLAQKKANALLKTMPSGVVIVDEELKIVECNENFANILGEDTEMIFEGVPGLKGASLDKIIPFANHFETVLKTGNDLLNKDIKINNSIIHGSIFTIEKHRIIGGIFQDITAPAMYKNNVMTKTKKVIEKNLETVQKIAYLLGENASETEIMLDSIIHSFSTEQEQ